MHLQLQTFPATNRERRVRITWQMAFPFRKECLLIKMFPSSGCNSSSLGRASHRRQRKPFPFETETHIRTQPFANIKDVWASLTGGQNRTHDSGEESDLSFLSPSHPQLFRVHRGPLKKHCFRFFQCTPFLFRHDHIVSRVQVSSGRFQWARGAFHCRQKEQRVKRWYHRNRGARNQQHFQKGKKKRLEGKPTLSGPPLASRRGNMVCATSRGGDTVCATSARRWD
mmetsp:Transcript_30536/g.79214  ORF Transcript_30536/g.79214 Transcript_30536/m.79214 type:complete len:226 (-) Transcript_30536:996-1673(-)